MNTWKILDGLFELHKKTGIPIVIQNEPCMVKDISTNKLVESTQEVIRHGNLVYRFGGLAGEEFLEEAYLYFLKNGK